MAATDTQRPVFGGRVAREPVVMALGTGRLRWAYETLMIGLALGVVYLLALPNTGWVWTANAAIWAVFVVDYFARLALSTDRRTFVRRNIPDLIAILPLDFFRIARLARLARLLRAGAVLWRVSKDVRGVIETNGLAYVLAVNGVLISVAALAIRSVEPGIGTLGDAVWWSVVTATTVGYGDLSPATPIGRAIAGLLMLVGIGTIGMVTGSIATYFIGDRSRQDEPADVGYVRQRLPDWANLTASERKRLVNLLDGCVRD